MPRRVARAFVPLLGLFAAVSVTSQGRADPPGWVETATWSEVSPSVAPSARAGHAMAYDATTDAIYLFGGWGCSGSCPPNAEVWRWDWTSTQWTLVSSSPGPSGRYATSWVEEPNGKGVVLFGGFSQIGTTKDAWLFANGGWSQVTATGPTARSGHGMASLGSTGPSQASFVLVRGAEAWDILQDSWTLNTDDVSTWTAAGDTSMLPAVRDFAMTSLQGATHPVLYGGLLCTSTIPCNQPSEELWHYTGATWETLTPAGTPHPGLFALSIYYDSTRGRAVLFGGRDASGQPQAATTELFETSWITRSVQGPPARAYHAMAYDPVRKKALLFGGSPHVSAQQLQIAYGHLGDTWVYEVTTSPCTSAAECDTGQCVDGACCEVAQCGPCETCGSTANPGYCEPVLDGPDDDCSGTCDASGLCVIPDGQPCDATLACASGNCVRGVCCDAGCTGVCAECTGGSCGAAPAGETPTSDCEGMLCDGTSDACPASCDAGGCASGVECVDGACVEQKPDGDACDTADECTSGYCEGSVCCASACGEPCSGCTGGSCGPLSAGSVPVGDCHQKLCDGSSSGCPPDCTEAGCTAGYECRAGACVSTQQSPSRCDEGLVLLVDGTCAPVPPPFDPGTPRGPICAASAGTARRDAWMLVVGMLAFAGWAARRAGKRRRRRRGGPLSAAAAAVARATLFALLLAAATGCETTYEVDAAEPCRQAGYSIAARSYACTGDEGLANDRYEAFADEYRCLVVTAMTADFQCAVDVNNLTCDDAALAADDLDAWLEQSKSCSIILVHADGRPVGTVSLDTPSANPYCAEVVNKIAARVVECAGGDLTELLQQVDDDYRCIASTDAATAYKDIEDCTAGLRLDCHAASVAGATTFDDWLGLGLNGACGRLLEGVTP